MPNLDGYKKNWVKPSFKDVNLSGTSTCQMAGHFPDLGVHVVLHGNSDTKYQWHNPMTRQDDVPTRLIPFVDGTDMSNIVRCVCN